MDYNSILNKLEEQKRDEQLSAKLFRYTGLMQAIEFFSQKLNAEQIIDSAFDFVNELLLLDRSAIFTFQGESYMPRKVKGYYDSIPPVNNSPELQNLALLYGTSIFERSQLERFFDGEILEALQVTAVIPLIVDGMLFGFIFISSKADGEMHEDDYIISEALMRLFNNALENYKRYEELQKANKELDEKVFNLFAINQSSKALLSELNQDVLYNLSLDVFSELTQSSVTGFFLYDEKSERYVLKSFKDVFHHIQNINIGLVQEKTTKVDMNRVIINLKNTEDILYFNSVFTEGVEKLKALSAEYVVLLLKNGKILGLVTLGMTITGVNYRKSIFELIESLASATYIAVSNAQLFRQVNEQKKVIQSKLEKIISLNNLMKNINSSMTVETLTDMAMKTLEISFGVEKGLIALYDREKDSFLISKTTGGDVGKDEFKANENWRRILEGDTAFAVKEEDIEKLINKRMIDGMEPFPGLLISPICIERVDIELLGIIMIFKYRNAPVSDEESLLTIETIAGHLAPVLSNLFTIEEQRKSLLTNYEELFKRDLMKKIDEALELSVPFEIIRVVDTNDYIFKESDLSKTLQTKYKMVYPLPGNRNIFIITDDGEDLTKELEQMTGLENTEIKRYAWDKDFRSFKEFCGLLF